MPVVKQTTTLSNPTQYLRWYTIWPKTKFKKFPIPQESSRRKKAHSPPIMAIPLWCSNPRPLLLPHPQLHQSEMTLHGQILCSLHQFVCCKGIMANSTLYWWSPNTHLCQDRKGRWEYPTKTSSYPPHLILNKPQNSKPAEENVDGDHNVPSVHNPPWT